jgi:hypothetical protein
MVSGVQYGRRAQGRAGAVALLLLFSFTGKAMAQCASEPFSRGSSNVANAAAWQGAQSGCRGARTAASLDKQPALIPAASSFSMAAARAMVARDSRAEVDSGFETSAKLEAHTGSPIASRFDIRWQITPGPAPAWVQQNVPQWITDNAKNYRRRGLPLLRLWESSHYMVALGLSNHGVPGAYFTQKLP